MLRGRTMVIIRRFTVEYWGMKRVKGGMCVSPSNTQRNSDPVQKQHTPSEAAACSLCVFGWIDRISQWFDWLTPVVSNLLQGLNNIDKLIHVEKYHSIFLFSEQVFSHVTLVAVHFAVFRKTWIIYSLTYNDCIRIYSYPVALRSRAVPFEMPHF